MIPSISTIVSLLVLWGLLLAVLRRAWTSLALCAYAVGFVLLSSYLKQQYLGTAMTLADLRFFLLRPLENFHLFTTYPSLGATLIGVLLGIAVTVFVGLRWERPLRALHRTRHALWPRTIVGGVSLAVGAVAAAIAAPSAGDRIDDGTAWAAFQSMYQQQNPGGPIGRLNVFFGNRTFAATLPAERSQSRFRNVVPVESPSIRPDILLVLEESTFDTRIVRDCAARYCDHAMLHPPVGALRNQQGPLFVHTTGGGTWLTEFAVLSGFDWRAFGRGGAYAPVSLAPLLTASLPRTLRDLGYRTVAVHPTDGNFLSARSAYQHYGFEEFYDARSLGMPLEWGDTRDGLVFERALPIWNKSDGRPVFAMVLTIRNHGPHGQDAASVPAAFQAAAAQTTVHLADFLARMRDSSDDYASLAQRWLATDKPRVIAWFGDHQPEAAWDFTEHPERLRSDLLATNANPKQFPHLTYYQFSANFGAAAQLTHRDAFDVAYLGAKLTEFAGLPLNNSMSAARETARACNGQLLECSDRELVRDYLSYRIYELGEVRD